MTDVSTLRATTREPQLIGQTVVVIGGSAGIGLETARRARAEGADVILTGRDHERLEHAATEVGAQSVAAFDATDFEQLGTFFDELAAPIDHVLVTGPGPYYAPLAEFDFDAARRDVEAHLLLPMQVARDATSKVRPGGTLLFMSGTGGRSTAPGFALISALTAAMPGADEEPRARARAGPGEPDRGRVRRHAAVGDAPRRRRWTRAARSSAPRCRSDASSVRPTSPRWPSTS